jgi:hypothetical protein
MSAYDPKRTCTTWCRYGPRAVITRRLGPVAQRNKVERNFKDASPLPRCATQQKPPTCAMETSTFVSDPRQRIWPISKPPSPEFLRRLMRRLGSLLAVRHRQGRTRLLGDASGFARSRHRRAQRLGTRQAQYLFSRPRRASFGTRAQTPDMVSVFVSRA